MTELTTHQRRVLTHLIDGRGVPEIAQLMGFERQRGQEYIEVLRRKGILSSELPSNVTFREMHVQDSKRNPWPPPARYARVFPHTEREIVVRSTVPPRVDGLELPAGLPDERCVILSRPERPSDRSWSFVASRRVRWSLPATNHTYDLWTDHLARCWEWDGQLYTLPTQLEQLTELTQVIAWAIGVEAILYEP